MPWTIGGNRKKINVPCSPGIYMWLNTVSNKSYIGSSVNLYQRRSTHLKQMRNENNACGMLQAAYNKYGEQSMQFKVLLICEKDELLRYEQELLTRLKPEYNKRLIAYSNLVLKMSDSTKEKHRAFGKTRYPIEMIVESRKNHYLRGKHMKSETKEKLRQINLGIKHTEEQTINQSLSQMGVTRYFKTLIGKLISPDGKVFENISNLVQFGKEHNIDKRRLSEFYNGKRTTWGGWTYLGGEPCPG